MTLLVIVLVLLLIGSAAFAIVWWLMQRGTRRHSGLDQQPASSGGQSEQPRAPHAEPHVAVAEPKGAVAEPQAAMAEAGPDVDTAQVGAAVATMAAGRYGPDSADPLPDGSTPDGFTVKGKAGSMLYHAPESPYYKRTKPEVWFRTTEAAEAAGFSHWHSRRKKK